MTTTTAPKTRYVKVRGPAKNPYLSAERAATVDVGRLQDGQLQLSCDLLDGEGKRLVLRADALSALRIASRFVCLMTADEYKKLLDADGESGVATDIRLLREGVTGLVDEVLARRNQK